jgi:nucleoside-diphosphate-sugar epimerase
VDNLISGSNTNIDHLSERGNFRFINEDVTKFSTDEKLDYIAHMASIASPLSYLAKPIETLDANVVGTRRMLELARENNVKSFLFTSTSEVYGNPGDANVPTPEDYYGYVNSFGPRAVYDEGKRCAEAYCLAYINKFNVPIRISRIFNTFGPRLDIKSKTQYGRVIVKFVLQALANQPLTVYGDGTQTRSFCYITDQVEGLLKLLLLPNLKGEVINIGNTNEITILELANKIAKLTNTNSGIEFQPLPKDDPRRRNPDISKAKMLLGFYPKIGLNEGLMRTIEWFKFTK